jgi:hypothetical protein
LEPKEFNFSEANTTNLPKGYPSAYILDIYTGKPFLDGFDERKKAYLDFCCSNPARPIIKGFLYELARLETEKRPANFRAIEGALEFVDLRIDCADFVLLGIIRMLMQFGPRGAIPPEIIEKTKRTILGFKYWPDEPGRDSLCTWTENHQVLFATCEYLAGQMFPSETFTNSGDSGREKKEKARTRLHTWLKLRFRTGFNEWLSNVYYDEDISALLMLADFCDDELLVLGAKCMLDLLFYDMALNSFRGTFGCTHGRSYERQKKSGINESTTDTMKVMFGTGVFGEEDNMSGIHLALSTNYRLPKVIYEIASDPPPEMANRHRAGINIAEAPRWGLSFDNLDDGMTLLSFEAYNHRKTFGLFFRLLEAYNWWNNGFFKEFKVLRRYLYRVQKLHLLGFVAWLVRKDAARNMREEVHTSTYRTPDYMLSAALDYKKGWGGDQHHIWQATLSEGAICFTTHPGSLKTRSPDYWTGSGFLPRVGMHKNVLVAIYKISSRPAVYVRNKYNFTHAFFPKDKFDEVAERGGWLFGRRRKAYIALYSQNGYRWQTEGDDKDAEIIADGKKNIWICEMGREETSGSFEEFQRAILAARMDFAGLNVSYESPSCGQVRFGWRGEFRINGKRTPLRNPLRYDNPYAQTDFDPQTIEINKDDEWLRLELDGYGREYSSEI